MTIREQIVEKIRQIPENRLPELYKAVEEFEEKETPPTLMERLRNIKIQGPSDFAENFDLYMNGEKSLDDYQDNNENIR